MKSTGRGKAGGGGTERSGKERGKRRREREAAVGRQRQPF